jgi:PAS domain S-box-containing protein
MTQIKKESPQHESNQQLREEVEYLRQRLSELESSLDGSRTTITALQKSEQLYRTILENIPPVTYVVAMERERLNSVIYSSPQIEKILGHTSTEFLKDPLLWVNTIYPDDRERVMAESDRADLTGEPFDTEYRVISSDNVISWFHDESVLVKDDHGQPSYRVGILTDVTERKQAELAVRQLEDIYHQAINAAGAVPYVIDHDGEWKYIYIGEGISSLTGYSAEEITAEIWDSLRLDTIPRGSLANLTFKEADRLTNEDPSVLWECDFYIRTRDGQARWIADTSVKSFDEKSGKLLSVGIYQDITNRKLSEEVREKLIQELEQRNAELERLAYTLSHELKSPLITIRGFTGYLREDALSGNITRLDRDLNRIGEGTDKMLRLINELIDLMSVGRIAQDFTEFPSSELVNEALAQLREKTTQRHITVRVADDLPQVRGDRKRLLEVFQNLLDNSIKFMGDQPQLRIEIGMRKGADADPIFYVGDNGIGIDQRFSERIFGIFHKLDAMSEGTGIGLALVKSIIEMHGGKVWVESEGLGKGAMFCFTIPNRMKAE